MKIKLVKYIIVIFFLFVISVFFIGLKKDSIYNTQGLVGQKLTEIKIDHFSKKKIINDEDLKKSKFTLINFWASWCGPCREEHSFLIKLNEEKNLKLIGVNFKDKKNNALKFLNELGNPYDDLAKDELGKHSISFGIYGIPESILINDDLIIIKKFVGPLNENDLNLIKETINSK